MEKKMMENDEELEVILSSMGDDLELVSALQDRLIGAEVADVVTQGAIKLLLQRVLATYVSKVAAQFCESMRGLRARPTHDLDTELQCLSVRVSAPFRVGADSQEFPVARAAPRSVAKAPFPIFTETKPDHARREASQPKPKKKRHNWSAAEEKLKLAIERLGSSRIADITRSLEGGRTKEQVKSKIRTMVLKQQRSGH